GSAPCNVTVHNDQGWPLGLFEGCTDGMIEQIEIVRVAHTLNVPMVGHETLRDVVAKGEGRVSFDADLIVVVDPEKVAQLKVARQGSGFVRNAFHHIAISTNRVDTVIDDLVARTIEVRAQPSPRDRHSNRVGNALAERARSGFNPRCDAVLWMARC